MKLKQFNKDKCIREIEERYEKVYFKIIFDTMDVYM